MLKSMCDLSYKCANKIFGSFYMETVPTANNKKKWKN